jgi:hypothetical protein
MELRTDKTVRLRKSTIGGISVFIFLVLAGCGAEVETSVEPTTDAEQAAVDADSADDADGAATEVSEDVTVPDDIEKWLIEVGNDFPDQAKCVAGEMSEYSVDDFEQSFSGETSEPFDTELDAAYEKCDALLGITSDE